MIRQQQAAPAGRESSRSDADFRRMANAVRALAMDAVEKAQSGHPGMPMGMADAATVLFSRHLKFDPRNPLWPDRDRFILSAGHGSMLLYALAYLTGYEKITLEQIRNFRQLHSLTPGHPEIMPEAGIETTTGPLGQGIANSVGFALAERILAARFGDLIDHYTYVIASDGDLMEGISHEAAALAGHLKLGRLIVLFDDNGISIDGPVSLSCSDDTPARFAAQGWHVQSVDGHDPEQIDAAIARAQATDDAPSLICCKTHIGYGAPTKQDSESSHGAPLGEAEIKGARERLEWPYEPFAIPDDILSLWRAVGERHQVEYEEWEAALAQNRYRDDFLRVMAGDVTQEVAPMIAAAKQEFASGKPKAATRQCSGKVLEKLVPALPFLIGGSADLTGSVNTRIKGPEIIRAGEYGGQYIHYGVREHGMAAAMNGMALHGGIIPYSGTFLQFSDYCRPAIRLSALMKQRVIYVMTHDSIGLGEDGPTHQPVEHLAALRVIPHLFVMRPCDGVETAECWDIALSRRNGPSLLALTRQGLPTLREAGDGNYCAAGAYILREASAQPAAVLLASGSEVFLAAQAQEALEKQGIPTRLVSVPCMELFAEQEEAYRQAVLGPAGTVRVAVEAAVRQSWDRWIGQEGGFVGMSGFGESAPADVLYRHFGITPDNVVQAVKVRL